MPTVAGLFVVAIQAVMILIAIAIPSPFKEFVSFSVVVVSAVCLTIYFASLLWKGIGEKRTVGDVIVAALSGVVSLILHFSILYLSFGLRVSGTSDNVKDIGTSIYFSVVTWTTLGYGDIVPVAWSRGLVIIEVTLGYMLMALLIAAVVKAFQR